MKNIKRIYIVIDVSSILENCERNEKFDFLQMLTTSIITNLIAQNIG
jgi:hypothetical protein